MSGALNIVILAAGKGTRMRSALPKVLHEVGGCSLLEHAIITAQALSPEKIIVIYGHGGDLVPKALARHNVTWVQQAQQLGTGHAVQQALPHINDGGNVLVLYGDVPLTQQATLARLVKTLSLGKQVFGLMTAKLTDPTGYGRIVRDSHHNVSHIVEQKDASEAELAIDEVNTGIMACNIASLRSWLNRLDNKNAQGEFYLTDTIGLAVKDGFKIETVNAKHLWEILGVNNKLQLAELERQHQRNIADALMTQGVTLLDPARIDVRGTLTVGTDVKIDVNTVFEGDVALGNNVYIGPNCVLKASTIADNVVVHANSIIDQALIGADCTIGPFARIRPESVLQRDVHIGNFVEIKKARVDEGSKINHLSYVGDAIVGKKVNIGAGTITCNYDGANKYQTIIEDNVFVGSDSQLVAPVTIGQGSTIGAGSTITKNTPQDKLTLSRTKQVTIDGWIRPVKKPKS